MASNLDAKMQESIDKQRARSADRLSKPRLVADPSITHKDIMAAIRNFINLRDSKDLQSIIAPHGLRVMTWRSAIDVQWCLKLAPLVCDILAFAPNSKAPGKNDRGFAKAFRCW